MNPGVFTGFGSRPGTDGRVFVLTESDAAFPIPRWAQGGKGLVLVTGCGAGGGGRTATGGYGGSGAWANRFPLLIPAGAASMSCAIGVAGDPGVAGGNTTLSINGTELLSLGGGGNGETGVANRGGNPGVARVRTRGVALNKKTSYTGTPTASNLMEAVTSPEAYALRSNIGDGMYGGYVTSSSNFVSILTNDVGGIPILGYFGGGGATNVAGMPGVLLLEFMEGF